MTSKTTLLALLIPVVLTVLAILPYDRPHKPFHSAAELRFLREHKQMLQNRQLLSPEQLAGGGHLPIDSNILFPTAKTCGGCHGFDPLGFALITTSGKDVNMYDDWRSTMMANAARDPFWRAKVTHEILVNPAHSLQLQDKCTSCHAPAGHYQAKLKRQQQYYTLYEMYDDSLGLDGITCQICHAQAPDRLGDLHSGELNFDTNFIRVAYGPFEVPFQPPMRDFVGITPLYGEHMADAGLCAGCHTLITGTVDLVGMPTGGTFVEQATYHEWLNSRYDEAHDNVTCQKCHIPKLLDEIIISANYQFLAPQFPYDLHELAGANVTMLKLMKANRDKLEIPAEAEQFDSTIAATLRMLQEKSVDMQLEARVLNGDTAYIDLVLVNKAGHKFPSGYPARRAWVEFEVKNVTGETVFHSGRYDPDFSLPDEDANFEPHHNTISRPDQVQIYELVPGDVSGAFTNVLERGDKALKDNRLVPQGFSLNDLVYDTTQIAGTALLDPDFNRDVVGAEGTGGDVVHFHIPINGYAGLFTVNAKLWYQSLPPKWMAPMFAESTPEIDSFRVMFDAADRSPVLVASVKDILVVSPVSTSNKLLASIEVRPSFSTDGNVWIDLPDDIILQNVWVWNSAGQRVWDKAAAKLQLPSARGVYFIEIQTNRGRVVRRVVRGG
ncbi:MAG: hypothetical protein H6569_08565 [Lewinellaceae bacterium]|nr:hypothetical protein [Lewinellaceae bacterium]